MIMMASLFHMRARGRPRRTQFLLKAPTPNDVVGKHRTILSRPGMDLETIRILDLALKLERGSIQEAYTPIRGITTSRSRDREGSQSFEHVCGDCRGTLVTGFLGGTHTDSTEAAVLGRYY